ncbi:hypothetical protein HNQ64_000501 [Prosthecobacter dejongeii]|uniref:HNH nuclease domain-containing protein n=2 Tax=Prosthecobacter dejongeii TaxID=48465 RepID=A0A7W7YHS8_9BACT|nr:hypothetical protein [Prosthecobacter dejongeii]
MSSLPSSLSLRVKMRAGDRCEYCRLPAHGTQAPFEVEHIIPRKHQGNSSFENLAWSCAFCNRHKGVNISGLHPITKALVALYHPRRDSWDQHFKYEKAYIRGRTPEGLVTVQVLNMNQNTMVLLRLQLMAEGLW